MSGGRCRLPAGRWWPGHAACAPPAGSLPGRAQRAADHAGARGVHGIDVGVRFGCGDLLGAEREAKHLLSGGDLAPKAWRRLHRVAGRDPDVGHRAGGPRHRQGEEQGGYGGDQGSAPHQGLLPTRGQRSPRRLSRTSHCLLRAAPKPRQSPKKRRLYLAVLVPSRRTARGPLKDALVLVAQMASTIPDPRTRAGRPGRKFTITVDAGNVATESDEASTPSRRSPQLIMRHRRGGRWPPCAERPQGSRRRYGNSCAAATGDEEQ